MTIQYVFTSDDATMAIPSSCVEDHITWILIHGSPSKTENLQAAAVISSFEYLISGNITMKEAARRLSILRKAYKNQGGEE